jgi:hypothetical protein
MQGGNSSPSYPPHLGSGVFRTCPSRKGIPHLDARFIQDQFSPVKINVWLTA